MIKDLTGQRFGRLRVTKLAFIKMQAFWECICDCGKKVEVRGFLLRKGRTKSCGCLQRELSSIRMSGENNWIWKGNSVKKRALHSRFYKKIIGYGICKFCKKECKTDLANISGKYKTELNDWMWLCRRCHSRFDKGWIFEKKQWYKTCSGCNQKLLVNINNFNIRIKNGRVSTRCKICCSIYQQQKRKALKKRS